MSTGRANLWALYGGAGFIGQHLSWSILNRFPQDRVCLLDIQRPSRIRWKLPLQQFLGSGRLTVEGCDVRDLQSLRPGPAGIDVMVNLAAVHREPGHRPREYFATNVSGAENVCRIADELGCREIIFTSSISVYGVHGSPVDEDSLIQARTPYGRSKRQAELIHLDWAKRSGGRLTIIRPGVVFGRGEEGNVSRLVRQMLKSNRAIRIEPDRAKAGIYIEELLEIIHWLRARPLAQGTSLLVNGVSNDQLTFNAYGCALQSLRNLHRAPLTVSAYRLKLYAALMNPFAGLFPAGSRIHPQRLGKLLQANDIRPAALDRMGYPFAWPLERALADWLDQGL